MRKPTLDLAIGLLTLLVLAGGVFLAGGTRALTIAGLVVGYCVVLLFLWSRESAVMRFIAVCMFPPLLLMFLMPRKARRALDQAPDLHQPDRK